ncbi:MAG: response regulator [Ardenticatenaceae bacterium]|nr:response regulator [Ardenticatenaceae bacterium]HBY93887.1 hypothetical protein [Chloroflexota bacterium]
MAGTRRLLIVDDEEQITQLFTVFLRGEGYGVEGFTDPRVALNRLEVGSVPDLIILDLMMPLLSGWDLLDSVRAHPRTAETPVILLTAAPQWAQTEIPLRSLNHCILLGKPIALRDLLKHIETMLPPRLDQHPPRGTACYLRGYLLE